MRAFTVQAAAFALNVHPKWLDNAISRHALPGVVSRSRGVNRRIPSDAVVVAAIGLALQRDMGLPLPAALALSRRVLDEQGVATVSAGIAVTVDTARFRREVEDALVRAAEEVASRPRGRPPHKRRRLVP